MKTDHPLNPERLRNIRDDSFAFVPHRFLRDGFLSCLDSREISFYLFLILASDRLGISFYSYDRICSILQCTVDDYILARNGLINKDLIAFDGKRFQVLSLPTEPVKAQSQTLSTSPEFEEHDPATVHQIALQSLGLRK